MNLYFLGLFQGCKKKRRESISEYHLLPNNNLEGYHIFQGHPDEIEVDIFKNGKSIINYNSPFWYIEFVPKKDFDIYVVKSDDNFNFHFYFGSEVPLQVKGTPTNEGFSSCLKVVNFDDYPIRRKNFVRRTLNPTFVDFLVKN